MLKLRRRLMRPLTENNRWVAFVVLTGLLTIGVALSGALEMQSIEPTWISANTPAVYVLFVVPVPLTCVALSSKWGKTFNDYIVDGVYQGPKVWYGHISGFSADGLRSTGTLEKCFGSFHGEWHIEIAMPRLKEVTCDMHLRGKVTEAPVLKYVGREKIGRERIARGIREHGLIDFIQRHPGGKANYFPALDPSTSYCLHGEADYGVWRVKYGDFLKQFENPLELITLRSSKPWLANIIDMKLKGEF